LLVGKERIKKQIGFYSFCHSSPCIARQIPNHWTTREAPGPVYVLFCLTFYFVAGYS